MNMWQFIALNVGIAVVGFIVGYMQSAWHNMKRRERNRSAHMCITGEMREQKTYPDFWRS